VEAAGNEKDVSPLYNEPPSLLVRLPPVTGPMEDRLLALSGSTAICLRTYRPGKSDRLAAPGRRYPPTPRRVHDTTGGLSQARRRHGFGLRLFYGLTHPDGGRPLSGCRLGGALTSGFFDGRAV
jgi:hypothetical protein